MNSDSIEHAASLPLWLRLGLPALLVFAFAYVAYYHGAAANRTLADGYGVAVARNAKLMFGDLGTLPGDAATLVAYQEKPSWLRVGQAVFNGNCAACHAKGGVGLIGPNLTDDVYKNVTEVTDLYRIVNNGLAGGAMPAWRDKLSQNERVLVAAYVASLRDTYGGSGGKAPEGKTIAAWSVPAS